MPSAAAAAQQWDTLQLYSPKASEFCVIPFSITDVAPNSGISYGRLPTSLHQQFHLLKERVISEGIPGRFWMHHFTEELWIQMFRVIGSIFSSLYYLFFLPESKHAACIKLIPLQRCIPLYQLYAISRQTTAQQNPWCYRRICEIHGTEGHTEHVFLSSSRLYALRACHFRGSVLLWTQGHKPLPWSERWNRFQPC